MTLLEHVEKELNRIKHEITLGQSKNARNYLDGFGLAGLTKKQKVLEKILGNLLCSVVRRVFWYYCWNETGRI